MQSNGTNMSTTTSNCSNLRGRYRQTWTDKTKMICTILEVIDKICCFWNGMSLKHFYSGCFPMQRNGLEIKLTATTFTVPLHPQWRQLPSGSNIISTDNSPLSRSNIFLNVGRSLWTTRLQEAAQHATCSLCFWMGLSDPYMSYHTSLLPWVLWLEVWLLLYTWGSRQLGLSR